MKVFSSNDANLEFTIQVEKKVVTPAPTPAPTNPPANSGSSSSGKDRSSQSVNSSGNGFKPPEQ